MEQLFYQNLRSFLKDLILVFPEDDDLKIITSGLNIAIMDDDNFEIINTFYDSLKEYESMILCKDINFFLVNTCLFRKDSHQFKFFTKLNSLWSDLSENNENKVWSYIQIIYGLSKKISSE